MAFDAFLYRRHDMRCATLRTEAREHGSVATATLTEAAPTEAARPVARPIRPRRALPNGRALAGALLVTIGALGAFALATGGDDGPTTSYLVSARDLAAGESITIADVRFEAMELSTELARSTLNSTDGLDGAVVLHDLRSGELVSVSHLAAAATAAGESLGAVHEVAFGIPLDRSPAGLAPGDRVTLLATAEGTTTLAVEDAVVLAIDTQPDQIGSNGRGILTLAIDDPTTVMEIAHLTQVADITVVRSTRALDDRYPASVGGEESSP